MQACQNHGRTRVNRTEGGFAFIYWFWFYLLWNKPPQSLLVLNSNHFVFSGYSVDWLGSVRLSKASFDVSWVEIIWKCFGRLSRWLSIMAGTCRKVWIHLACPGLSFSPCGFRALSLSSTTYYEAFWVQKLKLLNICKAWNWPSVTSAILHYVKWINKISSDSVREETEQGHALGDGAIFGNQLPQGLCIGSRVEKEQPVKRLLE